MSKKIIARICSLPDCDNKHKAKGYCKNHYERFRLFGKPDARVIPSLEERFFSKVDKTESCWLWEGGIRGNGYGGFDRRPAHRVSWEMNNGQIPDGMNVLHKCDVRICVNIDHLFLGTQSDNMNDMYAKGRGNNARGLQKVMTNLNDSAVINIRNDHENGETGASIARRLGLCESTISMIVNRKRWTHVL